MSRGVFLYHFDWQTGGKPMQRLTGHVKRINAMDMDPVTENLVTGGADGVVLLWDSTSTYTHTTSSNTSSNDRSRKRRASYNLVDHDNW
jgi:WD40 repeat protein